jgi:hypothetical protein
MFKGIKKHLFSFCLPLGLFLALGIVLPLGAQAIARGNLVGFIYDKDGTTPLQGAVIKLKNISTGSMYQSDPTDKQGAFRVDGLSKGIYTFGITTKDGDFNSNELIGILENETTKISISLSPYEGQGRSAMQEIARELTEKEGETRIGHVVRYSPETDEAVVFVEKGVLEVKDRVRVKGLNTNFYQDVASLVLEGTKVKRAVAGQNPYLKVVHKAEPNDAVYLVCPKGVTPFFLTPCGIAALVAGAVGIIEIAPKNPVSPTAPTIK